MAPEPETASGANATARKRKAHKKSRLGCRNCKLRRVKCSEIRPTCEQCDDFGVVCNYDLSIPDLQPRSADSSIGQLDTAFRKSPLMTMSPVFDQVVSALQANSSQRGWKDDIRFDHADLARLDKFQTRTIMTLGTKNVARMMQSQIIHLASTHRFLMHLVQAITSAHDRYLYGVANTKPCSAEAYHMNQALVAFQTILSRPIHPDDRDPLMCAASVLGVVSFFNLEASSVEDVWPLVDCDMSWLMLNDGKKAIYRLVNPMRPGSMWRHMAQFYEQEKASVAEMPDHTPTVFDHLCSEDPDSPSAAMNPYYKTASGVVLLLDKECNDETWLDFLGFLGMVDPPFRLLLERRRPWALLLLCYWYMKVCRGAWWISSRSILQGQAICLYLERNYPRDTAIQSAIIKPRLEFEAAQMDGWGGIASAVSSPPSYGGLPWL